MSLRGCHDVLTSRWDIFANPPGIPVFFRRIAGLFFIRANHGEAVMANREQKSNREKKKPKADKDQKTKPSSSSSAPAYVAPELVRKPHKGKDWT
jgi:hypothetical protein